MHLPKHVQKSALEGQALQSAWPRSRLGCGRRGQSWCGNEGLPPPGSLTVVRVTRGLRLHVVRVSRGLRLHVTSHKAVCGQACRSRGRRGCERSDEGRPCWI